MKVDHHGNTIEIDGKSFKLEQEVREVLPLPDRVIVLFHNKSYSSSDPRKSRNMIALDRSGKVLWRVPKSSRRLVDGKPFPNPYIGFDVTDGGRRIIACDQGGMDFDLDPETGQLSNPVFTR